MVYPAQQPIRQLIVYLAGLLACALLSLSTLVSAAELALGSPAPPLTITLHAANRAPLAAKTLAELKGSVVYVDFWASWCAPCRLSMPYLDQLAQQHAQGGLRVLGVNKDQKPADAERMQAKLGVKFPLLDDADNRWAKAFDAKTMPTGFLIDRKGVIRHIESGFRESSKAELAKAIELLLKEPQ